MLVSRLVLNLRTYSDPELSAPTLRRNARNPTSTVDFAHNRFLGNIGAPLESGSFGWTDENDDGQGSVHSRSNEHASETAATAGGVMTLVPVVCFILIFLTYPCRDVNADDNFS